MGPFRAFAPSYADAPWQGSDKCHDLFELPVFYGVGGVAGEGGTMAAMERLEDKAIVLLCCLPAFALAGAGTAAGAVVLCLAVSLAAAYEVVDARGRLLFPFALCTAAAMVPACLAFVPLAVYDLSRDPHRWALAVAGVPFIVAAMRADAGLTALVCAACSCLVAFLLARRTAFFLARERQTMRLRDALAERTFALQEKCDGLAAVVASPPIDAASAERPVSFAALTDREYEIVQLIADGLDNKQIAAAAYMGEGTVRNHISAILSKLDLKSRTQIAIAYLHCR